MCTARDEPYQGKAPEARFGEKLRKEEKKKERVNEKWNGVSLLTYWKKDLAPSLYRGIRSPIGRTRTARAAAPTDAEGSYALEVG